VKNSSYEKAVPDQHRKNKSLSKKKGSSALGTPQGEKKRTWKENTFLESGPTWMSILKKTVRMGNSPGGLKSKKRGETKP